MKKISLFYFLFFAAGPLWAQPSPLTPVPCTPADYGAPNFVTFATTSQLSPGVLQVWTVSYEPIHDVSARVAFNDGTQAFSPMAPAYVFSFSGVEPQYMSGGRVGASCFIQTTSNIDPYLASMGVTDLGSCSVICAGRVELGDLVEIAKLPQVTYIENGMYMGGAHSTCGYWVYYACVPFDPAARSVSAVTITGASASGAAGTGDGSFILLEYDAADILVDPLLRSAFSKLSGFFYLPPYRSFTTRGIACPATPTATPFPTPVPADTIRVSKNLFRPSMDAGQLEIKLDLHGPDIYRLEVFNSAGEQVKIFPPITLQGARIETLAWDGNNKAGEPVASGLYLIRLATNLGVLKARVLVLR